MHEQMVMSCWIMCAIVDVGINVAFLLIHTDIYYVCVCYQECYIKLTEAANAQAYKTYSLLRLELISKIIHSLKDPGKRQKPLTVRSL